MKRPFLEMIEIDREGKTIYIENKQLHRAIDTGAALVVVAPLLPHLQSTIESVDTTLAALLRVLTTIFEATYLYLRKSWKLVRRLSVSAEFVSTGTATINIIRE